jgi:NADH:ubiquinone oxidoreductase subunit 5 (subunit L)/multisubunit Na+/H+ antiporter MnhA subunit
MNVGSCLAGLFGRYLGSWGSAILTTSCLFLSFLISLFTLYGVSLIGFFIALKLATGLSSEILGINWDFIYAILVFLMYIIATFVSIHVHFYSTEFMSHDTHLSRFMSYRTKLIFFMLSLLALAFLKVLLLLLVAVIIVLCS